MKNEELIIRIDERVGTLVTEMTSFAKRVRKAETRIAWIMGVGAFAVFAIGIFVTVYK